MDDSILIVSTNWIGDAIMGMPAIQRFRAENPNARITMLAKPGVKALWQMHPAINDIQLMEDPLFTVRRLRAQAYDRAYIFPNSLRSGFVPWAAGIPKRVGQRGHWRRLLLTEIIPPGEGHQQFEYRNILGLMGGSMPVPRIDVPEENVQSLRQKLADLSVEIGRSPMVTLLPGAARGPSKRWPAEHFIQLAKNLHSSLGAVVVLGGGPDDAAACADMAAQSGDGVVSLAGKTSIPEWAALLKLSDCVVSNDSGGMHLATAVGTPVVAIFGCTDPEKTGPLGRHFLLQKSAVRGRDIARVSEEAVAALASIAPAEALAAVESLLEQPSD